MEDPLFDPWNGDRDDESSGPPAVPPQDEVPTRWRSRVAPRVPRVRPAPQPIPRDQLPATQPPAEPDPAEAVERRQTRIEKPSTSPAAHPEPPPSRGATVLREMVLPRVREVARRLDAAGHRTLIDDRTGGATPAFRFQLRPRRGPFDGPDPGLGPTLEILIEDERDDAGFTALVWLDPMAPVPSERRSVPTGQISEDRVDEVLLDFVGRALRGG